MFPLETTVLVEEALNCARAKTARICTVETVTSGLLAAALTSVSGASAIFERGFILYHADAKATGLNVNPELSRLHGAVSSPVTEALANQGLQHSGAGISIAVTGYAGPTGGNENDPVGTCYISVSTNGRANAFVERYNFEGDRDAVRLEAVDSSLRLLNRVLSDYN